MRKLIIAVIALLLFPASALAERETFNGGWNINNWYSCIPYEGPDSWFRQSGTCEGAHHDVQAGPKSVIMRFTVRNGQVVRAGAMRSKFAITKPSVIRARIRADNRPGFTPVFWLQPFNASGAPVQPELDIWESIEHPTKADAILHMPGRIAWRYTIPGNWGGAWHTIKAVLRKKSVTIRWNGQIIGAPRLPFYWPASGEGFAVMFTTYAYARRPDGTPFYPWGPNQLGNFTGRFAMRVGDFRWRVL